MQTIELQIVDEILITYLQEGHRRMAEDDLPVLEQQPPLMRDIDASADGFHDPSRNSGPAEGAVSQ